MTPKAIEKIHTGRIIWLAIFTIFAQIIFVTPLFLFATNQDEFSAGFFELVEHVALPALIAILTLLVALNFLPRGKLSRLAALLTLLSIAVYIQGYILVWDYGLLDGGDIPWDAMTSNAIIDVTTWALCLLLGIIFWRAILRQASRMLIFILALQCFNVSKVLFDNTIRWRSTLRQQKPAAFQDLARFSPERNVIYVLLDTFEAPAFSYILQKHPEYKDWFNDFTYFHNTLSSFPTTAASIPAILTGVNYDNSVPFHQFVKSVMPDSLPSLLFRDNFQVDLVTLDHYCNGTQSTICTSIAQANGADFSRLEWEELFRLLDLSLFRHSPQPLKKEIFNDQLWFLQNLSQKRTGPTMHVNSIGLIDSIVSHATADAPKPTFKFYHLMIPHLPLRLDMECNFSREFRHITPRNFSVQSRCGLFLVNQLLEKLKALSVYDNSLIIISADHGFKISYGMYQRPEGFPQLSEALPLLLIKPPNHHEEFEINDSPVSLTDIPRTVANVLQIQNNFPGEAMMSVAPDAVRTRIFRHYSWKNDDWAKEYLPPMTTYSVTGHALDPKSWQRVDTASQP